ncbi:MAG: large conductance mechanosensitive channel protein MscL, partial [Deltaproteobacteria bacterium]
TMNIGVFVNTIISFIFIALAVFLLIKSINRLNRKEEAPAPSPTTKACPYCTEAIPVKAIRCPRCTSDLKAS